MQAWLSEKWARWDPNLRPLEISPASFPLCCNCSVDVSLISKFRVHYQLRRETKEYQENAGVIFAPARLSGTNATVQEQILINLVEFIRISIQNRKHMHIYLHQMTSRIHNDIRDPHSISCALRVCGRIKYCLTIYIIIIRKTINM